MEELGDDGAVVGGGGFVDYVGAGAGGVDSFARRFIEHYVVDGFRGVVGRETAFGCVGENFKILSKRSDNL